MPLLYVFSVQDESARKPLAKVGHGERPRLPLAKAPFYFSPGRYCHTQKNDFALATNCSKYVTLWSLSSDSCRCLPCN